MPNTNILGLVQALTIPRVSITARVLSADTLLRILRLSLLSDRLAPSPARVRREVLLVTR